MYRYFKKNFLVFARSLEMVELMEDFFISAISTIILVRIYLNLANFPQVGGGALHISHMLWGGLLMLIALTLSLSYLNKEARRSAAFLGGIGFGLFIDEIGKFVSSDNNYFFNPTFALIYMVFVIFLLGLRSIMRSSDLTDKEYALNALEVMKEVVFYDLDEDEKKKALLYLNRSDARNPIVKALKASLKDIDSQDSINDLSRITLAKRKLKDFVLKIVRNPKAAQIIVTVFILMSVIRLFFAIVGIEWQWDFWEWGRQLSSIAVFLLVVSGINYQRKGLVKHAYKNYLKASILSILLVQFFDFYHDQLSALFYLVINIVIYLTIHYIISEYPRAQAKD